MIDEITCTHENYTSYTDGNEGGFTKFVDVCDSCKEVLDPERD